MAKIKELVTLKTGYANFVDLKKSFEAAEENADLMSMYRPTKAHREAFERICRGLVNTKDKKFYLLSGSYGTGKSHLCLMTANFLSRSSRDPSMAGFYENYEKLDAEEARHLKNIRKDGQYLVAVCDYHSGRKFEDVVLKAVFEACNQRGFAAEVQTEFDEALSQLSKWEEAGAQKGFRDFFKDFNKALENEFPGVTVSQLRAGLDSFDSKALEQFRAAFSYMMGGIEFQAKSGNIIPIIKKLIKSEAFKQRFKGLAIFFDEFGTTLESGRYSKDILQGFMEAICNEEPNVIFVGCVHRDFTSYADRLSKADASVMQARMTQVDLRNEGIEEIIAAIVETDKKGSLWKEHVTPKTAIFDQLVPVCRTLDLFPWIEDIKHIRSRVLEDIYGVHPMALHCLLRLSSEIGSNARSTFTFFSGDIGGQEGSYADFIEKTDIIADGGKLSLYTVEQLFTFFGKELSERSQELRESLRQFVNGYYAGVDAMKKARQDNLEGLEEDERLRILRIVLIYHLSGIPATADNIKFGYFCLNTPEKRHVDALLKDLLSFGALFLRRQSNTYELAVGTGEDPYELIDRFLDDTDLHPVDITEAFLSEAAGKESKEFLDANSFNLPFGDDKRFKTIFLRPKDIDKNLWDSILKEQKGQIDIPAKSYEGTLVYALCENDSDLAAAREAAKHIPETSIALAVPYTPSPFYELVLKVKACRYYLSPETMRNLNPQTESRLRDILNNPADGYLTALKRIFTSLAGGSDACWFTEKGLLLVDKPQQRYKPADMLCEMNYKKRCRIKHSDLNKCHDERWKTGKNSALKSAASNLLLAEQVYIDNGNPDSHGEKRYLEKVLFKGAGALKRIRSEGTQNYFICETDPGKIHDSFPVLKELALRLSSLPDGHTFPLGQFLKEMREPPYGVGGNALVLSLAHIIRGYGEGLTVYKDSTKTGDLQIRSFEDLIHLIGDPYCAAVLSIRNISAQQLDLINRLALAVQAPRLAHGETRSVRKTHEAIAAWYKEQSAVAGIVSVHEEAHHERIGKLKNLLTDSSFLNDPFGFFFEHLPRLYLSGYDGVTLGENEVKKIAAGFGDDVVRIESTEERVRSRLAGSLCEVFGTEGDMIECEKALTNWYKSLNPSQRKLERYDDADITSFLNRFGQDSSFMKKVTVDIPKDFGFGSVSEWTSLHIKDYAAKIAALKADIDRAKIEVTKPHIQKNYHEIGENDSVTVDIPGGAAALLYTTDGSDPRVSEEAARVTDTLNMADLLVGKNNTKVTLRAVDAEGNYSEAVRVDLVDKKHKYDLNIQEDLYAIEATFKWPEDLEGLTAVIRSLLDNSVKKGLLSKDQAERIVKAARDIAGEK